MRGGCKAYVQEEEGGAVQAGPPHRECVRTKILRVPRWIWSSTIRIRSANDLGPLGRTAPKRRSARTQHLNPSWMIADFHKPEQHEHRGNEYRENPASMPFHDRPRDQDLERISIAASIAGRTCFNEDLGMVPHEAQNRGGDHGRILRSQRSAGVVTELRIAAISGASAASISGSDQLGAVSSRRDRSNIRAGRQPVPRAIRLPPPRLSRGVRGEPASPNGGRTQLREHVALPACRPTRALRRSAHALLRRGATPHLTLRRSRSPLARRVQLLV